MPLPNIGQNVRLRSETGNEGSNESRSEAGNEASNEMKISAETGNEGKEMVRKAWAYKRNQLEAAADKREIDGEMWGNRQIVFRRPLWV